MKASYCFYLLCIGLFLTTACQKEEDITPVEEVTSSFNVPDELTIYFTRFEQAAQERGLILDLAAMNISAEIEPITEDGVAGTCSYGSHQPGHIVIDQQFWEGSGVNFREMIVFHELGHCALFQGHREGRFANGTCASIMRSGLEPCRDNYHAGTREQYLDELFGAQ